MLDRSGGGSIRIGELTRSTQSFEFGFSRGYLGLEGVYL